MMLFETASQPGFAFPQPLSEKYRPKTIAEFIGLDKQKKILSAFAKRPTSGAWLFVGPSGVGKSTMALAFAEEIKGELHKIPSQKCNLDAIENVVRSCWYAPMMAGGFHVEVIGFLIKGSLHEQWSQMRGRSGLRPANARDGMIRRLLFLLAWPLRVPLALFGLLLGACLCSDDVVWEQCKRDVRNMMKAWPK